MPPDRFAQNGRHFAGWTLDGLRHAQNPLPLVMNADKTVEVAWAAEQKVTFVVSGHGAIVDSLLDAAGGSVLINTANPTRTVVFEAGGVHTLTAIPADGYGFVGWQGDSTIAGRLGTRSVNTAVPNYAITSPLFAETTVTAVFAPCGSPYTVIDYPFNGQTLGQFPGGWTGQGAGFGQGAEIEREDGSTKYVANGPLTQFDCILERPQENLDTDTTFAYRFTSDADESQGISVQTRYVDFDNRAAVTISPTTLAVTNRGGGVGRGHGVDFYSERDTWYAVRVKTLGDKMHVWIQKQADKATPVDWDTVIASTPPAITNGDYPLLLTSIPDGGQMTFRVNLTTKYLDNPGALQVDDMHVDAWPCDTGHPVLPPMNGQIAAYPVFIEYPSQTSVTVKNTGTTEAKGHVYIAAPFGISPTDFDLQPGATQEFTISFAPPAESAQDYTATIYFVAGTAATASVHTSSNTNASTDGTVIITEILPINTNTYMDESGQYPSIIELHNVGTADVDLHNWCLTDTSATPGKWRFRVRSSRLQMAMSWFSALQTESRERDFTRRYKWTVSMGGTYTSTSQMRRL